MKALLLLLLATPAMAMDPEVDCSRGGSGLYEQSMCKDRTLAELRQRMLEYLPAKAVGDLSAGGGELPSNLDGISTVGGGER